MTGKIEKSGESAPYYIKITHIQTGKTVARVPWGEGDDDIANEIVKRWNIYEELMGENYKATEAVLAFNRMRKVLDNG